jgi:hypothetical protein
MYYADRKLERHIVWALGDVAPKPASHGVIGMLHCVFAALEEVINSLSNHA